MNKTPDKIGLPINFVYPDAWRIYVEYLHKAKPVSPARLVTEFLEPFGLNKRVVITDE